MSAIDFSEYYKIEPKTRKEPKMVATVTAKGQMLLNSVLFKELGVNPFELHLKKNGKTLIILTSETAQISANKNGIIKNYNLTEKLAEIKFKLPAYYIFAFDEEVQAFIGIHSEFNPNSKRSKNKWLKEQKRVKKKIYNGKYYQKNRLEICRKVLYVYSYKSMDRIKKQVPEKIAMLYNEYPFEVYGASVIKWAIRQRKIFEHTLAYQECYDAGMTAYLYSIHQCALNTEYSVKYYVIKMVKIYIDVALIIYNDTRNICKENNFRNITIDDPNNYFQV